jgi:CAAX protease family protein
MADQIAAGPLPAGVEWRHWGLGEAYGGIVMSQVAAATCVVMILVSTEHADSTTFPMWLLAVSNLPLQLTLGAVALTAAARRGGGVVRDFFVEGRWSDVWQGLIAGVAAQFLLVPVVTLPIIWLFDIDPDEISEAARDLTDRANDPVGIVALVLAVAVLAPVVEELFFRGLLYGALRKRENLRWLARILPPSRCPDTTSPRWNVRFAIVGSGMIFGAIHFQPLLFPALTAVGMLFAWLYERHGRLAFPIFAHIGFNATTVINILVLG